jgi:antagonist of KipI
MAYYLFGAALVFSGRRELLSSAVSFGTVQALPDGGIVVLMADHQTTGGYPRVAHIASAHLPKLAQFSAGDAIRFRRVSLDDAEKMLLSQQARTERTVRSCIDKLQAYGRAYRS